MTRLTSIMVLITFSVVSVANSFKEWYFFERKALVCSAIMFVFTGSCLTEVSGVFRGPFVPETLLLVNDVKYLNNQ